VSGGVGRNIDFEIELTEVFGCKILLFDPSPTGIETMLKPENQHRLLEFIPEGLAARDGLRRFAPPISSDEGSWRKSDDGYTNEWICRSVSSISNSLGGKPIELLKLDIEGFEYEVLHNVLSSNVHCHQILVELHTAKFHGRGHSPTIRKYFYMVRLFLAGFRLVHQREADYSFARECSCGTSLRV